MPRGFDSGIMILRGVDFLNKISAISSSRYGRRANRRRQLLLCRPSHSQACLMLQYPVATMRGSYHLSASSKMISVTAVSAPWECLGIRFRSSTPGIFLLRVCGIFVSGKDLRGLCSAGFVLQGAGQIRLYSKHRPYWALYGPSDAACCRS